MSTKLPFGAKITGTGSYVPPKVLTNHDLEKLVETSDEWITERTGIKERHIAPADMPTSAMAEIAARKAMEMAGVAAEEIELIIFATLTPDARMPNAGCYLQARLGAKNAAAFGMEAACSGFLYALKIAGDMVRCGSFKTVLVVGAEQLSKVTNWTDRNTCVLFGDGAGAVLLQQTKAADDGQMGCTIGSDGTYTDLLVIPAGGSRAPVTAEAIAEHQDCIKMAGKEIFKLAVGNMLASCNKVLQDGGKTVADIRWLIPHQANTRIINAIGERLQIPPEKVFINLHKYGNTSAASIPIALDEVVRSGQIERGEYLLFTAFGGGLTWGATLWRW